MKDRVLFSLAKLYWEVQDKIFLFIDPEFPNWISTNEMGAKIIWKCDGHNTIGEIVSEISKDYGVSLDRVMDDVKIFVEMAKEKGFLKTIPDVKPIYKGRSHAISPGTLKEVWINVTNNCNFRCAHCVVSSRTQPKEDQLTAEEIKKWVDEAISLGVSRIHYSGGEPFLRRDFFDILKYTTERVQTGVITNGSLLHGQNLKELESLKNKNLILQVSLEGSTPEVNDAIRGKGNFSVVISNLKRLIDKGITPIVTTTITKRNHASIVDTNRFLASLGIRWHHIGWLNTRGWTKERAEELLVPSSHLTEIMRELRAAAKSSGILVDNEEFLRVRVKSGRGRKIDLCKAGYEMLAIDADGQVYPCPPLTGDGRFDCGSIREHTLKDICLDSEVMNSVRELSVQKKEDCYNCVFKFICGGGCFCQAFYYHELISGQGSVMAQNPYCDTYKALLNDLLWGCATEGIKGDNYTDKIYPLPKTYNAMDPSSGISSALKVIDVAFEVEGYPCT